MDFSLKRFILASFLCSSLSVLAVQAAEPASLMSGALAYCTAV
ncbi:hypothetical protein [Megasphaera sp.]